MDAYGSYELNGCSVYSLSGGHHLPVSARQTVHWHRSSMRRITWLSRRFLWRGKLHTLLCWTRIPLRQLGRI